MSCCGDCGTPYGEEGWCDAVIPDEVWNKLTGTVGEGLLCLHCMTKRLVAGGFTNVPLRIFGAPYELDRRGF